MNIQEVLEYFGTSAESYSPTDIILILGAALAGGLVIFLTYRFTCDAAIYNRGFNVGNLVTTVITAVVMMMISSNIVISLGMVGALSIVRFRTALKEPRDTVFVFWSLVTGLCAGSKNFILTGISVFFISALFFLFSLLSFRRSGYTLIVRGTGDNTALVEQTIRENVGRFRLRAVHTNETSIEYVYKVRANERKCVRLVHALQALEGVSQANLVEADET